ncbi:ZN574 protein, partial [Geococcyx californianus]|nr:ZN574 protein [Geococcyx californianus]
LFSSQDVWLAHRQSHRAEAAAAAAATAAATATQNQALVDLEHSYQKLEEGEEDDGGGGGEEEMVQLLLYECGECLQLFQSPKDFLEHQAAHLTPPVGAER